jgi:mRNA capping enzyme, beta chain
MEYELFNTWEPLVNMYKHTPGVEIEIRFGRRSGTKFDTNVGRLSFEKCLRALEAYTEWENTSHTKHDVYYFEDGKRMQINEATDDREAVIKRRILVNDFELKGLPFDVRLGISSETPFEYDGETATEQKNKERWSFLRKNLRIDLSKITGNPDDPDDDQDTSYQIEMEIVKPSLLRTQDQTFKLMYKVFDVIKCL